LGLRQNNLAFEVAASGFYSRQLIKRHPFAGRNDVPDVDLEVPAWQVKARESDWGVSRIIRMAGGPPLQLIIYHKSGYKKDTRRLQAAMRRGQLETKRLTAWIHADASIFVLV
jgi:hypothetical protein